MNRLRFALAGVGMMGREHIRNLGLHPQAELVALQDLNAESLARGVAEVGGPVSVHHEISDMLALTKPDVVIVATPNHTHRQVLEPLFATGVHLLCEKPLCTTVEDARWAAAQAAKSGSIFWTGMEYRFMPPAAAFIARAHAGEVGRLVQFSIREHRAPFKVKVGDWNRFSRNTGGTMVEKCCHFFDLMRLVIGVEPTRVYCSGAMDVNHLDERYGGETPDIIDNSYTIVDFANGARAMLELCMFADGSQDQESLTVVGDQAKLEAFIPSGDLVLSPRNAKPPVRTHVAVDRTILAAGAHHGATYFQLAAFIDAVRGAGRVQVSADDGLRAVAMGAAAERSALEKRPVEMSEMDV